MAAALIIPDLMTVDEFLVWDAPEGYLWQLVDGAPVASSRFVLRDAYSSRVALGLASGGLLGVPAAAFIVKSLYYAKPPAQMGRVV